MSSTTKTTNYNLSQFADADKPTWRGDYNGDMLKIDRGMQCNANAAADAHTAATNAQNAADTNATAIAQVKTTADDAKAKAEANESRITANANEFQQYKTATNATLTTMSGQITSTNSQVAQIRTELTKVEDTGTACRRSHQGYEQHTINNSTPEVIVQYAIAQHEASWGSYSNGLFTIQPGVYLLAVSGRVSKQSADKALRMYIKRPGASSDLTYIDYYRESANSQTYTKAEVLIVEDAPLTFGTYTALLGGASSTAFTYEQDEASVSLVCLKSHGAPLEYAARSMTRDGEEPESTVTVIPLT